MLLQDRTIILVTLSFRCLQLVLFLLLSCACAFQSILERDVKFSDFPLDVSVGLVGFVGGLVLAAAQ